MGDTRSFDREGDPLTAAVDFSLIIGVEGIMGRYLGSNTQIPLTICREIEKAILAINYGNQPAKDPRTGPYVVLNKVMVAVPKK